MARRLRMTLRGRMARHRAAKSQKAQMKRLFRLHEHHLATGAWVQTGRIAVLEGATPPSHVRDTVLARELDGRHIARQRIIHSSRQSGTGTVMIDSGSIVVLDPSEGSVLRIADDVPFGPDYVGLRRRFQRYVPSPSFSVSPDGRILTEKMLSGVSLEELESDETRAAMLRLLERFVSMSESEHERLEPEVSAILEGLWRAALETLSDDAASSEIDLELLQAMLLTTNGLPGKGPALGQNNLIVVEGDLHCIDFPRMAVLPAWSDGLILVLHSAPYLFREPAGLQSIQRLFDASGIACRLEGNESEWAAIVIAVRSIERLRVDRPQPLNEVVRRGGISAAMHSSIGELRAEWAGHVGGST